MINRTCAVCHQVSLHSGNVMNDEELKRLAREALLRDAVRGSERSSTMGPKGWLKCPVAPANRRFLHNTIMSSLQSGSRLRNNKTVSNNLLDRGNQPPEVKKSKLGNSSRSQYCSSDAVRNKDCEHRAGNESSTNSRRKRKYYDEGHVDSRESKHGGKYTDSRTTCDEKYDGGRSKRGGKYKDSSTNCDQRYEASESKCDEKYVDNRSKRGGKYTDSSTKCDQRYEESGSRCDEKYVDSRSKSHRDKFSDAVSECDEKYRSNRSCSRGKYRDSESKSDEKYWDSRSKSRYKNTDSRSNVYDGKFSDSMR